MVGSIKEVCSYCLKKGTSIPDLLPTLSSLCNEEGLIENSEQLVEDISNIAICLSKGSPERTAVLLEAGWANLLIRALKAWHRDEETIDWTTSAIHTILCNDLTNGKAAFITAGAETELMTVMNMKRF
mmetsp:Transcript_29978/g.41206  ORF Transcript_29978/g.41206 Transcript_29978/m.41206 type:complete len:128 (+) Transcript_29978:353-736(+)